MSTNSNQRHALRSRITQYCVCVIQCSPANVKEFQATRKTLRATKIILSAIASQTVTGSLRLLRQFAAEIDRAASARTHRRPFITAYFQKADSQQPTQDRSFQSGVRSLARAAISVASNSTMRVATPNTIAKSATLKSGKAFDVTGPT